MILPAHPVPRPPLTVLEILAPLLVAALFIFLMSLARPLQRQQLSALIIAGAGSVYYGSGLGWWEVAFCALFLFLAFRGLQDYRYIGGAWLLHTAWDILHHLYAQPILPFVPLSSFGCALCDTVLALWYLRGAPSLLGRESPPLAPA